MFHTKLLSLGEECFQKLCRFLNEHRLQLGKDAATTKRLKMIFLASAYISEINASTLERTDDGEAATFEGSNLRL